ncbi:hypothetical protein B0H14DRAFT_3568096, partial [Mycena olivaceomarginata]
QSFLASARHHAPPLAPHCARTPPGCGHSSWRLQCVSLGVISTPHWPPRPSDSVGPGAVHFLPPGSLHPRFAAACLRLLWIQYQASKHHTRCCPYAPLLAVRRTSPGFLTAGFFCFPAPACSSARLRFAAHCALRLASRQLRRLASLQTLCAAAALTAPPHPALSARTCCACPRPAAPRPAPRTPLPCALPLAALRPLRPVLCSRTP